MSVLGLKRLVLREDGTVYNPDERGVPFSYEPKVIQIYTDSTIEVRFFGYPKPNRDECFITHGIHFGFRDKSPVSCGRYTGTECLLCDYLAKATEFYGHGAADLVPGNGDEMKKLRTLKAYERYVYTVYAALVDHAEDKGRTLCEVTKSGKGMLGALPIGSQLHKIIRPALDSSCFGPRGTTSFLISKTGTGLHTRYSAIPVAQSRPPWPAEFHQNHKPDYSRMVNVQMSEKEQKKIIQIAIKNNLIPHIKEYA